MVTEGDEDASLVCEYENAAADLIQSDSEMAACYNAYVEARKRLADRFRSRGFWPLSQKGRGKGGKGRGKGKGFYGQQRRNLQRRILNSSCRLCGQRGHWKAECPQRNAGSSKSFATSSAESVPISFTSAQTSTQALPLEFVQLPQHLETSIDEPRMQDEFLFGLCSFDPEEARRILREKQGDKISTRGFSSVMSDVRNERHPVSRLPLTQGRIKPVDAVGPDTTPAVLFASHGSYGVADLGASKTVIGSQLVGELIRHLHPSIQSQLYRCPCHVNFRFGNQAILRSQEALVIPLSSQLHLTVAVVPGATPFLLSNALLRTLQAVVDTGKNVMWIERFKRQVPLHLTDRGLYLIDINNLCIHKPRTAVWNNSSAPEHQICRESLMQKIVPKVSQSSVNHLFQ